MTNVAHMRVLGAALAVALFAWGCADASVEPRATTGTSRAEESGRPGNCRRVPADRDLADAIASAEPGAVLCLEAGTYRGQFDLTKRLEIWGTDGTVVRNSGEGSTFRIGADGVELHDLEIVGSGQRYTKQDAGVFILEADDVVVEGVEMRDVLFGISAQKANRLTIRGNSIRCRGQEELGMRGDGVRFWEVRRSRIADNTIRKCRDLVMWYAPENIITGNRYLDGRYGTHFMYASRNIVRNNFYRDNSVGVFVMYSRHLRIEDNIFARSAGSSGMGLGLKESGDLEVVDNTFAANGQGTYIDASPLQKTNHLLYALNDFRINDQGIVFHNEPRRTVIRANTFRHNGEVATIQGGGSAVAADWNHNYFGSYAGYDFDGDGIGDVPYELRSFSQTLKSRYPKIAFLTGTPAMAFIETATRLAPLYQPELLVRDREPTMAPPTDGDVDERVERILREDGFLRIRDGEHIPLVDPPDRALSKEY